MTRLENRFDGCLQLSKGIKTVMAGLDPAIHAARLGKTFERIPKRFGVDARDKPGHDGAIGFEGTASTHSCDFPNGLHARAAFERSKVNTSMTLEQLKVFVAVARALHMTRAAASLHMTQSAVSASVAALEASCGVALFHRVGRRIELTEAGRAFVPEADAVLARAAAAETVLADLSGLRRGRLALEASQTIANYWLGPVLNRFHTLYPDIALSVVIGNTTQVTVAVREGTADLGFVEGEVEEPLLARTAVPGDRLVLVAAANSPFAERRAIAPADLFEMPFVLREPGSGTRQVFEDALRASGLDPAGLKVVLELPSNEAVVSAVAAGAGATVISDLVAAAGLATGTLRQLPLSFPARRFHVLRHADRYHSRAAQALMALIREPEGTKTAPAAPVSRPRSRARR